MSGSDRSERSSAIEGVWFVLIVVICCVIVGGVSYSQGRESERRDDARHTHAESAKAAAKSGCVSSDPVAVFECVYDKVEASEETARSEQDLDAQQSMAFWAFAMTFASIAMAVISGVALIYLRDTFRETRSAAKAAHVANRPWLVVKPDSWKVSVEYHPPNGPESPLHTDTPDSFHVRVEYKIENIGNTPAKNIATIQDFSAELHGDLDELLAIEDVDDGPFLAPGQNVSRGRWNVIDLAKLEGNPDLPEFWRQSLSPFRFFVRLRYGYDGAVERCVSEYEFVIGRQAGEGNASGWMGSDLIYPVTAAEIGLARTHRMT